MYDPNLPVENTEIDAVQMRSQLQGLKALIDAINAIIAAIVDGVTTVNPGDPAQASVSVVGNTLHFTFTIPQGFPGADGGLGPTGPQGPPFATAIVDGVSTLPAGSAATVSVSFDGNNVHFTFGIPEGQTGGTGGPGEQGPPGEVTNAALGNAINSTSSNSNAVPTMDVPFANDPPTLVDMETMRAAYNALVLGLRRP